MSVLYVVIAVVALQRIGELIYAERNTRRLRKRGAFEVAAWQHPLFVALHASWLLSLIVFIPAAQVPNWWLLCAFFGLQFARLWVLASLGPYWTTRIMTLPGAPLVRRGPYRFMKHPNYAIVALEIALLPLAFGAWVIAVIFTIANAGLTTIRIGSEDDALMTRK